MHMGQELPIPAVSYGKNRISIGDSDRRADNYSRTVHFEGDRIVIMRRVCGVSMRVTIAVNRFSGIGVRLPNLAESRRAFQVVLVHADPDLCVSLYESANPLLADAAVSEWAQYFELPVLDGADVAPSSHQAVSDKMPGQQPNDTRHPVVTLPQVGKPGALRAGSARTVRRRGAALSKRRPRLYARRKAGEIARMDSAYGNEREIIARN